MPCCLIVRDPARRVLYTYTAIGRPVPRMRREAHAGTQQTTVHVAMHTRGCSSNLFPILSIALWSIQPPDALPHSVRTTLSLLTLLLDVPSQLLLVPRFYPHPSPFFFLQADERTRTERKKERNRDGKIGSKGTQRTDKT
mmetsp:Transcript_42531/g.83848  ORF Transcript_42531/g.83848 Transcript_42531/m.83848 type:complete len:140 (+) Transcript_42531:778-1197(+)